MKLLALVALLMLALWPHAAAAQATSCAGGCQQYDGAEVASGTSVSVSTLTISAGSAMIALVCVDPASLVVSATSGGSAMTLVGSPSPTSSAHYCQLAYRANMSAGTPTSTLTVTGGTCVDCTIIVMEWKNLATSSIADGSNSSANAQSQSAACGNMTTTGPNSTLLSVFYTLQDVAPTAYPSGFSHAVPYGFQFGSDYLASQPANTYNPAYTSAATSFNNFTLCMGLKPLGGGGGTDAGGSRRSLMGVGS